MEILALDITIREAVEADATQVALLSSQLGYPADSAAIAERLVRIADSIDSVVFVAVANESNLVGWIEVKETEALVSGRTAGISGLVVDERFRRVGIGRKLVGRAEEWTRERGFDRIGVRSDAAREGSHDFYPSIGFELVKTQRIYRKGVLK